MDDTLSESGRRAKAVASMRRGDAAGFHVGVQTLDVITQPRDVRLMSGKVSRIALKTPVFGLQFRMFREERLVLGV